MGIFFEHPHSHLVSDYGSSKIIENSILIPGFRIDKACFLCRQFITIYYYQGKQNGLKTIDKNTIYNSINAFNILKLHNIMYFFVCLTIIPLYAEAMSLSD